MKFKNCFIRYLAYNRLLEAQKRKLHRTFLERVGEMRLRPDLPLKRRRALRYILLRHATAAGDDFMTAKVDFHYLEYRSIVPNVCSVDGRVVQNDTKVT